MSERTPGSMADYQKLEIAGLALSAASFAAGLELSKRFDKAGRAIACLGLITGLAIDLLPSSSQINIVENSGLLNSSAAEVSLL